MHFSTMKIFINFVMYFDINLSARAGTSSCKDEKGPKENAIIFVNSEKSNVYSSRFVLLSYYGHPYKP